MGKFELDSQIDFEASGMETSYLNKTYVQSHLEDLISSSSSD